MGAAVRERLLRCHGDRGAAEETVRQISVRALTPEVFECCVEDQLASSPAAWSSWLERGSREDLSSRIGRLLLPTLVIAGEGDPVLPASVAEGEVMPRLAEARLVILDGAGHLMPLEAPGEVAGLIASFIRSTQAGSPDRPASAWRKLSQGAAGLRKGRPWTDTLGRALASGVSADGAQAEREQEDEGLGHQRRRR